MWPWIKDRLDQRWKRVAFVLWLPVIALTLLFSAYAVALIYVVDFEDDGSVYECHREVAGDILGSPDPEKHRVALERFRTRFSAETREVEDGRAFMRCITNSYNGSYWLNYRFGLSEAGRWISWSVLFALVFLPRFWRRLGLALSSWVSMKT
jgi:hypothetical protein